MLKKVLIAHQSTIPHYRVPFYNVLEHLRPDDWCFDVVFDPSELESPRIFQEPLNTKDFQFPILETNTLTVNFLGKRIRYQTFWLKAAKYDLVIVENAVNNLTYPLCQLHQLIGVRLAYWGHGKDRNIEKASGLKSAAEKLKIVLARRADGFFAYSSGVKAYLEGQGLSPHRVFALNNTIDINEQREAFIKWHPRRQAVQRELGIQGKKVLLFVGRFTPNKRIDFLLESFSILLQRAPDFHLLLVGNGKVYSKSDLDNVSFLGAIVDPDKLGPIYVASDIFAFPGSVGLAPLQALCYDLPIVTVESATHKPEIEYLSPLNSIVLAASTTPEDYAQAIIELFDTPGCLKSLRQNTWASIKHLTIEQMAEDFIRGINTVLGL